MAVFIGFVVVMLLVVLIGTAVAIHNFDQNVKQLFSLSKEIEGEVQVAKRNTGLPGPVKRYLAYALSDHNGYISYVRLRHYGKFRTALDARWSNITGEEYFTVEKPGFIWKGSVGLIRAVDSFVDGKGSLKVYLLPFLRIAKKSGHRITQGQLLRWLGESVWFPTALLPSENLHWEAIDDHHAKLVFIHGKREVYYIVTFNDQDQIIILETRRYMDGKKPETWIGKLSDYKMIGNMMIPTTMEAIWKLRGKEHSYALFRLDWIEYNNPKAPIGHDYEKK